MKRAELTREQVGGSWEGIGAGTVMVEDGKGGYRIAEPHEIPEELRVIAERVKIAQAMIAKCDEQIEAGRRHIALVLSNRKPPTGLRVRLTPSGGPTGEVMNYRADLDGGSVVAMFDPKKVRDYLVAGLEAGLA